MKGTDTAEQASNSSERHADSPSKALGVTIPPVSRSELIAAINQEIKEIMDDTKRPGWSTWALVAGLATLLWIAMSEFTSQSNFQTAGSVFVFGSVFAESLLFCFSYIRQAHRPKQGKLRYRFPWENPNLNLPFCLFQLIRFTALLLVCYYLESTRRVPTLVLFCFTMLLSIIYLMLFRLFKPTPALITTYTRWQHLVAWAFIGWQGFLSYELFTQLPMSAVKYRVGDFRLGSLLVGIAFLLTLLVSEGNERPSVIELKRIRRQLVFGQVSINEATKDADIVLSGLTTEDVIKLHIDGLLDTIQRFVVGNEKIVANCQATDLILTDLESVPHQQSNEWEANARRVALLIDSCETESTANNEIFRDASSKNKDFVRYIQNIHAQYPEAMPKAISDYQELCQLWTAAGESLKSSNDSLADIKARFKCISSFGVIAELNAPVFES